MMLAPGTGWGPLVIRVGERAARLCTLCTVTPGRISAAHQRKCVTAIYWGSSGSNGYGRLPAGFARRRSSCQMTTVLTTTVTTAGPSTTSPTPQNARIVPGHGVCPLLAVWGSAVRVPSAPLFGHPGVLTRTPRSQRIACASQGSGAAGVRSHDLASHRIQLVLTYSMRTSRPGRLDSFAALAPPANS
jgi:hypothetical protein